jgi:putative PIN family toxin of toxin-antitoxin system
MIRVVADTNILVSAVMFGGLPGVFLDLALLGSFSLVTSAVLLDELDEKLRLKFELTADDSMIILTKLERTADLVTPLVTLKVVIEDPDDNRVLECAIEGHADFIVSGDRHLLKLGSYESIPIMSVRRFLNERKS